MRSFYIPILCFVFLRFGALSLPGKREELRDIKNIFPELSDYMYDGKAGASGSSSTVDTTLISAGLTTASSTDDTTLISAGPTTASSTDDTTLPSIGPTTAPNTGTTTAPNTGTTLNTPTGTSCSNAGNYVCKDCLSPAYVNDQCIAEVVLNCALGTACLVSADATFAYCTEHASTGCSCGSAPKQCDFYESNNVLLCSTNGPFLSDPCADGKTCSGGVCVIDDPSNPITTPPAPPPGDFNCGAGYTGLLLEAPACQNAIYCQNGVQVASSECATGEYFDPSLGCQPAPPAKCDGNCAGLCTDKVDCQKFYVCDGNGNVLQHENCNTGEYFNPEQTPPKCEAHSSEPDFCPATSVCTAYTESPDATTEPITPPVHVTTDPSNPVNPTGPVTQSSNSVVTPSSPSDATTSFSTDSCNSDTVGTYEYPPDCTMYYWCQETSPGTFEVTVRQCWDNLAYNPVIGGCDYPANVPGCNVNTQ